MPISNPPSIDAALRDAVQKRIEAIVESELVLTRERIEKRVREEAAKVAITVCKFMELHTHGDTITIRIDSRGLKL